MDREYAVSIYSPWKRKAHLNRYVPVSHFATISEVRSVSGPSTSPMDDIHEWREKLAAMLAPGSMSVDLDYEFKPNAMIVSDAGQRWIERNVKSLYFRGWCPECKWRPWSVARHNRRHHGGKPVAFIPSVVIE